MKNQSKINPSKQYIVGAKGSMNVFQRVMSTDEIADVAWDDFYQDLNSTWLDKSRKLQARRWRKLKLPGRR